jgi:hypothetical protein
MNNLLNIKGLLSEAKESLMGELNDGKTIE